MKRFAHGSFFYWTGPIHPLLDLDCTKAHSQHRVDGLSDSQNGTALQPVRPCIHPFCLSLIVQASPNRLAVSIAYIVNTSWMDYSQHLDRVRADLYIYIPAQYSL